MMAKYTRIIVRSLGRVRLRVRLSAALGLIMPSFCAGRDVSLFLFQIAQSLTHQKEIHAELEVHCDEAGHHNQLVVVKTTAAHWGHCQLISGVQPIEICW